MEEITEEKKNNIYECIIAFTNILVIVAGSLIKGYDLSTIVKNAVIVGVLSIILIFVIKLDRYSGRFLYNNQSYFKRFFIEYLIFAMLTLVFSFLPSAGWLFAFVFITLGLFSSINIGIISGMSLLTMTVLLTGAMEYSVLEYLIPGIIGILMFSTLDSEFKVIRPMIVTLVFQLVFLLLFEVLLNNKVFSISMLIIPLVNIILCIPLLLFVLKIFSFTLLYKVTDRMQDVIDPEFSLMSELRNISKEDYDHAIFTAVLCSKVGAWLSLDESLMKALGYYHRIGIVRGDNSWEAVNELLTEYEIPSRVGELLKEYLDGAYIKSREIAILLFADTIISSIKYLFSKNKDTVIDYDKLINAIIDKKLESGVLADSDVSYSDMNKIRNALVNEKLFYDFLR